MDRALAEQLSVRAKLTGERRSDFHFAALVTGATSSRGPLPDWPAAARTRSANRPAVASSPSATVVRNVPARSRWSGSPEVSSQCQAVPSGHTASTSSMPGSRQVTDRTAPDSGRSMLTPSRL
ncbi:hypothetical protein [Fodinicola feengrottensis]|uniref:hypothetical protein n=1 Tax=Fodinicola feengrottensis TaxID=435914 RepID=UPI0013D20B29|nr:hypothetical protein [Fodinicola feengrottensis]